MLCCLCPCSEILDSILLWQAKGQGHYATSCISRDACNGMYVSLAGLWVIYAIWSLQVSQYQLSDQHVVSVCRAIFKEIHNQVCPLSYSVTQYRIFTFQSLPFVDRSLVYSIMEHFLVNHVTGTWYKTLLYIHFCAIVWPPFSTHNNYTQQYCKRSHNYHRIVAIVWSHTYPVHTPILYVLWLQLFRPLAVSLCWATFRPLMERETQETSSLCSLLYHTSFKNYLSVSCNSIQVSKMITATFL